MKNNILLLISFLIVCMAYSQKQFELYDAIGYLCKPDLNSYGLLPVYLMYENTLIKKNANNSNSVLLDIDKIYIQSELSAFFPNVMVSTDIENWFGNKTIDQDELYSRISKMVNIFKEKNSDLKIGNYGIAPSALCVYRFYNQEKEDRIIIQEWKENNLKRWKSIEAVDIIMPVVYIAEPNIESWIRDLDITISEIKKYNREKKIIVYIWPQYYDKPGSPYDKKIISPETWFKMLEAIYERCDGAIIWSARSDENGKKLYWNDIRIQAIWNATVNFINSHSENMNLSLPESKLKMKENIDKSFKIFASLKYPNTPDLATHGIHPIKLINDKDISNYIESSRIFVPDLNKIEKLVDNISQESNQTICLIGDLWIKDRFSNHEEMLLRYKSVKEYFRKKNITNQLGFAYDIQNCLTGWRLKNGNFFVNLSNWIHSIVIPTRPIKEYSDYLIPAAYIINDDIDSWKNEFNLTIQEAKRENPCKPVYALFYTDYFNKVDNFAESNKPIRESTWDKMLESAFSICDGIVMINVGNVPWNEDFGFWKATKKFIIKRKYNIVNSSN